ncbi:MAG: UDP-N-acetylmuramoyl-L-alanyl-D-glutamate--2,6-diaminopimelate ligase [Bdellovibrionaceae bacterium]|nr:UDP-N-acetylmuramoyl-L-alanyl-D-glutamate--2,6-diaminopimelate ligase [Pseudobdellovibrionaceae bacterium]
MNLQELFAVIPGLSREIPEVDVTGLFHDARRVVPGGVFVAIAGGKADGHDFLRQAVDRGAAALVVADVSKVPADFQGFVLQVEQTRAMLDVLASRFYHQPAQEMFCVGITGTNGKTSTAYLVEAILNAGGMPCGVIGTVNHHLKERVWPSEMTTPDPVFLQRRLREFRDAGAAAVSMEISSHALDQRRADSVPFNTVVFTNLTRDHLDYHADMEDYFQAKQRLFLDLLWKTSKRPCRAIVNVDDAWGRRLRIADPARLWTYGRGDADFSFRITRLEMTRAVFELKTPQGTATVDLPMGGEHNVQNAVAAIAVGLSAGIGLAACAQALSAFPGVPGRLQSVPNNRGLAVFVDYAHSPDALENVLSALRKVREQSGSNGRLWTVFGCGGDRDKGKRPEMARLAVQLSDEVVVTSDNPRTEDPQRIIQDILQGTGGADARHLHTIVDRRDAILFALENARSGDAVLIAGKGHEDYQIIGTEKTPFSDFDVAREFFQRSSRFESHES